MTRSELNRLTTAFIILTMIGLMAGIYSILRGHGVTYNVTREVPWGLLQSTFAFLALTAIGLCMMAAMSHAYGVTILQPLKKRAVYLCIVTLMASMVTMLFAVESPWRLLVYNAISPNLTSNIWWSSTLYGIMAGTMFLEFSALTSGSKQSKFRIGFVGAVAAMGANNNLGGIFTAAFDPPIWYGPQLLILFLASAILCGNAALTLSTVIIYRLKNEKIGTDTNKALQSAGTIMAFAIIVLGGLTISRYVSLFRADEPGVVAAMALMAGPLALSFWGFEIAIGLVAPLALLLVTQVKNTRVVAIAGALALTGAFFQRYNLVAAGQVIAPFGDWRQETYLTYFPSLPEILVVLGALSFCALGYIAGERYLGNLLKNE